MKIIITPFFICLGLIWHLVNNADAHWIWWSIIIIILGYLGWFCRCYQTPHRKWILIVGIIWSGIFMSTVFQQQSFAFQTQTQTKTFIKEKFIIVDVWPQKYLVQHLDTKQKYWLFPNYYEKNYRTYLNASRNDQLIICGKTKPNVSNNWQNLRWKQPSTSTWIQINAKQCPVTIIPGVSFRTKLQKYLHHIHNPQVHPWIDLLIFQELSPQFQTTWTLITDTNVGHLFAISGFHLWLMFGIFGWWLTKRQQKRSFWIKFLGFAICTGITYLTGWKLTTMKSLMLMTGYLLPKRFKIHNLHRLDYLTLIIAGLLCWNPWWIYHRGLQISCLASGSFYYFWPWITKHRWNMIIFSNGILPMILFPIIINLNYRWSPWFFIINFGLSALIFIYYPWFWMMILLPGTSPILAGSFTGLTAILQIINQFQGAIGFGEWSEMSVAGYYLGLIMIKIHHHIINNVRWVIWEWIFLFLGLTQWNWFQPSAKFHMINVQNGLAMIYQSPYQKTNILFDAGKGNQKSSDHPKIKRYLWKLGITKLDAVFLSHHHTDHYNNFLYLKKYFPIGKVITNRKQKPQYQINDVILKNLNFLYYQKMIKENNRGLVLQFNVQNHWILLTFDLEHKGELQLLNHPDLRPITIWQVGHHGLKSSSHQTFLNRIKPKYCLISSNKIIPETITKLEKNHCQVWHTKINHDLSLKLNPIITLE